MQRKILIIDDHDDLATSLEEVFSHVGHEVTIFEDRRSAIRSGQDLDAYDVVITDLDVDSSRSRRGPNGNGAMCLPQIPRLKAGQTLKVFKFCAAGFRRDEFDEEQLREIAALVLDYKNRYVDTHEVVQHMRERIEFEIPSAISLMHIVLEYLMKRVAKLGVVRSEQSNLFVALDEAFVNAVKHGNKFDSKKLVRFAAEVSKDEARFTIEDEGEGFDVNNIPDPLDPENLFKTSGRGVLFIYNIMDEVKYNQRGNQLTMVKRAVEQPEHSE